MNRRERESVGHNRIKSCGGREQRRIERRRKKREGKERKPLTQ